MNPLTHIKESVLDTWHGNDWFRFIVKLLTCPCFGCCYCLRACTLRDCTGERPRRKREKRFLLVSEITQARRERSVAGRKRSVSVDGRGLRAWRNRKTKEQAQSPLFGKVPREVRDMVWEYVLAPEGEIKVVNGVWGDDGPGGVGMTGTFMNRVEHGDAFRCFAEKGGCNTAVLRTCRKVYQEAVDILYSSNNLVFSSYRPLIVFVRSIPAPRLAAIKNITVTHDLLLDPFGSPTDYKHYRGRYTHDNFFALLSLMPKLRSAELKYVISVYADRDVYRSFYYIPVEELELLDAWENRFDVPGCEAWYEITGDADVLEGCGDIKEEGGGRELYQRWRVDERVRIGPKS